MEARLETILERLDRQNTYILRLGERLEALADHSIRIAHVEKAVGDFVLWRENLWKSVLVASASGAVIIGAILGVVVWVAKVY